MKTSQEALNSQQWVERYGDCMFRFALLRVNDTGHAEDLVQDTFLTALKVKDSFAGLSSEKTWLFGILKNKILDHYREKNKNQKYSLPLEDYHDSCETDFDGRGHWQSFSFNWGTNPEKAVADKELFQIFSGCMNALSPKLRQFYVLREIEGCDSETLCSELKITSRNLWVMLHRARNRLKKCIEAHLLGNH